MCTPGKGCLTLDRWSDWDNVLFRCWCFEVAVWLKMKLWSKFVWELVIWPKEVTLATRTQPSGPLCLWQCLLRTCQQQQPRCQLCDKPQTSRRSCKLIVLWLLLMIDLKTHLVTNNLGSKNWYQEYLLWQTVTVACIHFRSSEKTHLYTNNTNKPNIHDMVSLVYLALLTILFFLERKFMESFCYILHLVPFERCHSSFVKI